MNLVQYFLAFIAYAFVGWVYESLLYTVQEKKVISSGFLYGPYCPIYGGGAVIMIFVFYGRTDSPVVMFLGGMVLATLVEYFTAVFLENCFHKKWWDYSKLKYNFQGRICLLGAVAFGTMCLVLCRFIHPVFVRLISNIPESVQFWLAVSLAFVFIVDYMVTLLVLRTKKKTALENDEEYENKLPQLNLEMIFDSVHLKKKFKFSLRDKIHFGGVSYIVEKLKLKPFYIEKVEKRIEPIKEKLSELRENK
jgi:uncharacterized membrane protein